MLEELVAEGLIRTYGWSTDRADAVRAFSTLPGCGVVSKGSASSTTPTRNCSRSARSSTSPASTAARSGWACSPASSRRRPRSPLTTSATRASGTLASATASRPPSGSAKLDAIREVLTTEGRTLAQGALAWIWARSERTVPIPGFKTVAQVEENCGALATGPLTADQMAEIDGILDRDETLDPEARVRRR